MGEHSEYAAMRLAYWVLGNAQAPITHLKLQKLIFYCYGIAASQAPLFRRELGPIAFHAWRHGPVCQPVYHAFKSAGAAPISPEIHEMQPSSCYPAYLDMALRDVLAVYGHLDAWRLREQSHLEEPWKNAWANGDGALIEDEVTVAHFRRKFWGGAVKAPEYVSGEWSLAIDSIPGRRYETFNQLAEKMRAVSQRAAVS